MLEIATRRIGLGLLTAVIMAVGMPISAGIDDSRGVQLRLREVLGEDTSIPRYHALVIGINTYRYWQDLRRARPDAVEVADLLEQRYGFQSVTRLLDEQATRSDLTLALRRISRRLDENDALLIFYAGHGYFDRWMDRGYWVPYDGRQAVDNEPATMDWVSNSDLQAFISQTRARHVLVVSDSCFSGSLFRGEPVDFSDKANTWYRRAIVQPSRWGISSGDLELVPDQSVFARKFIEALQFPLQPVFAASDVAGRIRLEVAGQTGAMMQSGRLQVDRGSQFGEFIFLDHGGAIVVEPAHPAIPPTRQTGRESAAGDTRMVDLGDDVSLELVWIPPGAFVMGSPADESGRFDDEGPQHRVTISTGFWMGKHEVTQRQYQALMGSNPSHFKNMGLDAPVERVTWREAKAFCDMLQARLSFELRAFTARLPTEAEWEYACRAGTTTAFHYGNDLDASMANFDGNYPYGSGLKREYRKATVPVGAFPPNAFGLYDMHGNVWEWCEDGKRSYTSSAQTDPEGSGSSRVLRGGSWIINTWACRSAFRRIADPGVRSSRVGFRVVLR